MHSSHQYLIANFRTIPENPAQCENYNCNTDLRYGMIEDFDYYQNCKKRERNMGLFTADQVCTKIEHCENAVYFRVFSCISF